MSSSSRSRASISKQRGAEMSSRLMPSKSRGDRLADRDDLVGILRGEADRPRIDAAELLEEHGFPFHHRHCRLRPDVAEAEHRRPVRHDRDGVLLDGEVPRGRRIVRDGLRDAGDAWRVGHREVVAGLERDLRLHLDLATEVHEERPVGDAQDLDAVERSDGVGDAVEVCLVRGRDRDVSDLVVRLDAHDVDRTERASRFADRLGHAGEHSRRVVQSQTQRRAERRRHVRHGGSSLVGRREPHDACGCERSDLVVVVTDARGSRPCARRPREGPSVCARSRSNESGSAGRRRSGNRRGSSGWSMPSARVCSAAATSATSATGAAGTPAAVSRSRQSAVSRSRRRTDTSATSASRFRTRSGFVRKRSSVTSSGSSSASHSRPNRRSFPPATISSPSRVGKTWYGATIGNVVPCPVGTVPSAR